MNRSTRTLRALLAVAIAESLVHYTDNTLRYDDYTVPDPSVLGSLVKQWVIPVAWVLFTVAAVSATGTSATASAPRRPHGSAHTPPAA